MNIRKLLLSLSLTAAVAASADEPQTFATLDSIRAVVKREYFAQPTSDQSPAWAQSLLPDGRWPDIDYADCSRSLWQLEKHLDRLADLARSGSTDAAMLALNHWYSGNYHNDNWWYEKIGIPRRLLAIGYLLDDSLTPALRDSLAKSIDAIDSNDFPARPGGDRIQVISNHIKALLWKRDYPGVMHLLSLIEAEAAFAPYEETMYDAAGGPAVRIPYSPAGRGFQSDMTFHHRGDRVNSTLTYGLEIPEFYNYWHRLLRGTPAEFGADSREFVDRFVAEVIRWHLVRDRYKEPSAYNRELARPVKCPIDIQFSDTAQLTGARYFPQSAYFAFKRPRYESAVRLHSCRNANQEAPHNQEGIRNHFRGDGACHLSVTGEEYLNIWPLFDFRKVPGTTEPQLADSLMIAMPVQLLDSPISFAGAVTDNLYGACALDFISPRFPLQARKSWMFFDQGYVCCGSGITSDYPAPISTTVEQCLSVSGQFTENQGVYLHDGNTYGILIGTPRATLDSRSGTWANCVTDAEQCRQSASAEVFSLEIDHGIRPQDAKYLYFIALGSAQAEPWFDVVELSDTLHCVAAKDGSLTYCVFFAAGSAETPQGRLEVDNPCLVMLRAGEIFIADPTHLLSQVNVTLAKDNDKTVSELVTLPTGPAVGTTTKLTSRI